MVRFSGFFAAALMGLSVMGAGAASAQSVEQLRAAMLGGATPGAFVPQVAPFNQQVFAPVAVNAPVDVKNAVLNTVSQANVTSLGAITNVATAPLSSAQTRIDLNPSNRSDLDNDIFTTVVK